MFYKNFKRDILIVIVLFGSIALIGFGIYKFVFDSTLVSSTVINGSAEEKLGNLVIEQLINKQEGYYEVKSKTADSAVSIIKQRLLSAIASPKYHYKFYLVNNSQVNAFTLPGGNIVIFSGLLETADSAEQLAAVLAHEIGHAESKHVLNKMIASVGVGVVTSIVTGADIGLTSQILQKLLESKFDRSQEEEADEFALQLLEKSNINPKQLAYFFKKMNDKGLNYDKRLELIMTHPNNDARIKFSENYTIKANFIEKKIDIDWKAISTKAKL